MPLPRTRVRTAVPLTVAALALAVSGAGGAVAGSMITGAQIKNGTVTGADVNPTTLKNFTTVLGYEHRVRTVTVAPEATKRVPLRCSAGKFLLGASAYWGLNDEAVQVAPRYDSRGATAYATNPDVVEPSSLTVSVICAPVTGKVQAVDVDE